MPFRSVAVRHSIDLSLSKFIDRASMWLRVNCKQAYRNIVSYSLYRWYYSTCITSISIQCSGAKWINEDQLLLVSFVHNNKPTAVRSSQSAMGQSYDGIQQSKSHQRPQILRSRSFSKTFSQIDCGLQQQQQVCYCCCCCCCSVIWMSVGGTSSLFVDAGRHLIVCCT